MGVKIFIKDGCPRCPKAKELGKGLETGGADVKYYNIGEVNGLSESIFYDILSTPSIVVTDDAGKEVVSFRSEMPSFEELKKHIK